MSASWKLSKDDEISERQWAEGEIAWSCFWICEMCICTGAFSTSRTLYRKAKNGTYRETRDRIDRRDRQKVTTDK